MPDYDAVIRRAEADGNERLRELQARAKRPWHVDDGADNAQKFAKRGVMLKKEPADQTDEFFGGYPVEEPVDERNAWFEENPEEEPFDGNEYFVGGYPENGVIANEADNEDDEEVDREFWGSSDSEDVEDTGEVEFNVG